MWLGQGCLLLGDLGLGNIHIHNRKIHTHTHRQTRQCEWPASDGTATGTITIVRAGCCITVEVSESSLRLHHILIPESPRNSHSHRNRNSHKGPGEESIIDIYLQADDLARGVCRSATLLRQPLTTRYFWARTASLSAYRYIETRSSSLSLFRSS